MNFYSIWATDNISYHTEAELEPDSVEIIGQSQDERSVDPASSLLRLDFVHPRNGSFSNLRNTAALRMPPEVPVEGGLNDDPTGTENQDEITTKKTAGFFKGIEDFFKHSFHMDKTTLPSHTMTTSTENSAIQPSEEAIIGRGREISYLRSKQQQNMKGRDATFNFRIKAIALPFRSD